MPQLSQTGAMEHGRHCRKDNMCSYQDDPDGRAQLRCILCNVWHHNECVNEEETDMIWSCPSCSKSMSLIEDMHKGMKDMQNTQQQLMQLVIDVKDELKTEKELRKNTEEELDRMRGQFKELVEEMTNHRMLKDTLHPNPSSNDIKSDTFVKLDPKLTPPPPPAKTLLIGTSLLRNVDPQKLVNCEIISKGGAKVDDVSKTLASLDPKKKYKEIIIFAGSIDIESAPLSDVLNSFKAFTVCATDRSDKVVISSVLPRTDKSMKDKLYELNKDLMAMCNSDGHTFLDQDPTFHLLNGDVNSLLLHADGLHLSKAGVDSIIKSCGLTTKGSPYTTKRYTELTTKTLFRGHEHPLSNFFQVKGLRVSGKGFCTSEAAYQHEKAMYMGKDVIARKIQATTTGIKAKRFGSKVITNDQWKENKAKVMEKIVLAKLTVCKEAQDTLLQSGSSEIVEDTGHPFWARGLDGNGQNMMGKILMTIRKKAKEDPNLFKDFNCDGSLYHTKQYSRSSYAPHRVKTWNHESFAPQISQSSYVPQTSRPSTPRHSRPSAPQNTEPTLNWATRDTQPCCYRCGEAGHVQDYCRHVQDVYCWTCGRQGHKQKACYSETRHHTYDY